MIGDVISTVGQGVSKELSPAGGVGEGATVTKLVSPQEEALRQQAVSVVFSRFQVRAGVEQSCKLAGVRTWKTGIHRSSGTLQPTQEGYISLEVHEGIHYEDELPLTRASCP